MQRGTLLADTIPADAVESVAKILGLAIHGQAEGGEAPGPASLCTTGHNSADGHCLMDVSAK